MSERNDNPPPLAGEVSPQATEGASDGQRKPLPWEATKHPGFRAAAFIYLAAAAIMLGVGGYMLLGVGHPVMSVPVIAPALGAFYFVVRFAMMMRPKV